MKTVGSIEDIITVLGNGEKSFTVTSRKILCAFFLVSEADNLYALNLSYCADRLTKAGIRGKTLKLTKVIALSVMSMAFSLFGLRKIYDIGVDSKERTVIFLPKKYPSHLSK